jgi:hypothetical protein
MRDGIGGASNMHGRDEDAHKILVGIRAMKRSMETRLDGG